MLADGSASAAFLGGATPVASIMRACTSQEMVFLPFTEEAMTALVRDYAFFDPASIPANTYKGQTEEFKGLNVGSMHLITAANEDEQTVYEVTKALYENREKVVEKHPAGKAINPQNVIRDTGTEFHPGAIRYFKEAGIWKDGPGS